MDLETIRLMEIEYGRWLDLVAKLKATGAVTDADGSTPINAPIETPGQEIFQALREWGDSLAALRVAQA